MLLRLDCVYKSHGGLTESESDSVGLEWNLHFKQLMGDTTAAGPWTTL